MTSSGFPAIFYLVQTRLQNVSLDMPLYELILIVEHEEHAHHRSFVGFFAECLARLVCSGFADSSQSLRLGFRASALQILRLRLWAWALQSLRRAIRIRDSLFTIKPCVATGDNVLI